MRPIYSYWQVLVEYTEWCKHINQILHWYKQLSYVYGFTPTKIGLTIKIQTTSQDLFSFILF